MGENKFPRNWEGVFMRKLLISPILLSAFILCSCTVSTPKKKTPSNSEVTTSMTSSSQDKASVKEVVLDQEEVSVKPGSSVTLKVEVIGDNDSSQEVIWTSSNEDIATVVDGVVTISGNAKDGDKVTITAVSVADENKSASCVITVEKDSKSDTKYTVMMYVCGSNLESQGGAATKDIKEVVTSSQASENINFVIETGGASSWQRTYSINANKLQRWHVDNKKLVKDSDESLAGMGDANTLKSFLTWGKTAYPADKYALILWNHGGAASGVCFDENDGDDGLIASEIAAAVKGADINLEWIGYDACIMNYIDNVSINSDYAKYMVASQELENGDGWDYTGWVPSLYENPDISTPALLSKVCDSFVDFYTNDPEYQDYDNDQTLSVIDLVKAKTFVDEFKSYSGQLSSSNYSSMKSAYNNSAVLKFGNVSENGGTTYTYGVADFKSFIDKVSTSVSIDTTSLLNAYSDMVVYVKNGPDYGSKKPTGCNVFIAADSSSSIAKDDYGASDTKFTEWRNLQISGGSWYSGGWW